jgi:hypothetical protein
VKRVRERESEKEGEREGERGREREKERDVEYVQNCYFILKGMAGALAPFRYLVLQ